MAAQSFRPRGLMRSSLLVVLPLLIFLASSASLAAPKDRRAPAAVSTPAQVPSPAVTTDEDEEAATSSLVTSSSAAVPPPAAPITAGAAPSGVVEIRAKDTWAGWPSRYSKSLGYEASGAAGIIGRNLMVYGTWDGDSGREYFLGFEKAADTYAETSATSSTGTTTISQSTTSAKSGTKNPYVLTAGAGLKKRYYQGKWMQIYGGLFGGLTYQTGSTSPTGSITTTYPDAANTANSSVTETNVGSTDRSIDLIYFAGVKAGSEFYMKWFPNLALGFSTGVLLSGGGAVKTTSSTSSQSYAVTNGVPQTPTSRTSSKNEATTQPGFASSTFGVGGTYFSLTGLFSLRYVW